MHTVGFQHRAEFPGGKWVCSLQKNDPAPLFRRSFGVDKPVKRARLYAAGLGYYELRMNGRALSDHALDPAWTRFESRVYYTCHDLTDAFQSGENVLGAMLGNGWFNPLPMRMWGRINLRDHLAVGRPQLMAQLIIEYEDGSTQTMASDGAWKVTHGPILRNSVYLGEKYDARLEQPGWDRPGFDDSDWSPASAANSNRSRHVPGELRALPIPPIRVTAKLTPVSVSEVAPGMYIFDLGQNFAGWVRLRVEGPRGTTVRMRMGELLYADGTLNPMTAVAGQIKGLKEDGTHRGGPGSPEIAWQSNAYTRRGGGAEDYTPRFTFHGFRYVEVTGFPGTPTLESIEGLRLNTDVEPAGSFACSNERFNRLHEIVQWTFLSNLFSVQSDCPGREKNSTTHLARCPARFWWHSTPPNNSGGPRSGISRNLIIPSTTFFKIWVRSRPETSHGYAGVNGKPMVLPSVVVQRHCLH